MEARLGDYGVIEDLVPVDGWLYLQFYDGRMWRIPFEGEAKDGPDLIEQVRQFRINQGIPLGDPVFDVADFTKKRSPANDRFGGREVGKPRIGPRQPVIQACRDWLNALAQEKPELCGEDEATARAAVCQHCPQNIKWRLDTCGACNDAVAEKGMYLRRRIEFKADAALNACRLHRFYLPTAVFIDRDALPPRHQDAPAACWVGRSAATQG